MAKSGGGKKNEPARRMAADNDNIEGDIDALFVLPLAEFTDARNALAARLKQSGRSDDAARVKALAKPSVSAWAVNQLYWKHRAEFDRLIATSERFRQAQASQLTDKASEVNEALAVRRDALSNLSHLAAEVLRDAGHNPTPDILRRIATTLEAMSAYASFPNAPRPGRLTADLDPPGFEALAALMPVGGMTQGAEKPAPATRISRAEESRQARQARIARAKASVQKAEVALKQAKANAIAAAKRKREAEQRLQKASAAAEEAGRRAQRAAAETEAATRAVETAEHALSESAKELRSLLEKVPS